MAHTERHYYFLHKLETDYLGTNYQELAEELATEGWEFHGKEISKKMARFRWQYQKKQFLIVVTDAMEETIKEIIL